MMAFNTSPGLEMCDRSIFVLISSGLDGAGREALLAAEDPSPEPRRYARTLAASWSSRELECVFFSVSPTSGSVSRMVLLLTSSSLARSLIRILLIRLYVPPNRPAKSSYQPHGNFRTFRSFRFQKEAFELKTCETLNCLFLLLIGADALRRCFRFLRRLGLRRTRFSLNFFRRDGLSFPFFGCGFDRRFRFDAFVLPSAFRAFQSNAFSAFLGQSDSFSAFQCSEIIIDRDADFFHSLGADSFDCLKLLRRHISQSFHRRNACFIEFLNQTLAQAFDCFKRSRRRAGQFGHLRFNFLALFLFALDINLPAQQLGRQADVLAFLADCKRKLAIVHHDFEMLVSRVKNRDAAHLGGLQCL